MSSPLPVNTPITLEEHEDFVVRNTVATNILEVIGQGIDFPLRFTTDRKIGSIAVSNAEERINDAIHLILATYTGERLFNPEFGSLLPSLVHEPNDSILHNLLRVHTAEALARWEKRIRITNISLISNLNNNASAIGIHIEYRIRNSHIAGSYVYPFVKEGMPVSDLYSSRAARYSSEG